MNQQVDWQWLLWTAGYVVGALVALWVVLVVGVVARHLVTGQWEWAKKEKSHDR